MRVKNIALLSMVALLSAITLTVTANAEQYEITGSDMPLMLEVKQSDKLHFTGDPSGVKGFEAIDRNHHWFNCQSGWGADEYAVCVIDFSDFDLGYHEWVDRTTKITGKFYVMEGETAEVKSNTSHQEVSAQAKNFKTQIEAKISERITPLEKEIAELKLHLANSNEREILYQNQISTLKSELTTANNIAEENIGKIEELNTANATIEQYKKDAENWKAVALEQLKVMAEILGLF